MIQEYDKHNDIISLCWGKSEFSVELFDGNVVLNINDKDKIVGIEIFDFEEEIKKNNKKFKGLKNGV